MRNEKLYGFSLDHLRYEIDMCRKTASLLASGAVDGVLNDVLVESYAVHLRTLIEFIYGPSKNPDDLSAASFVKAHEPWIGARGMMPEPLRAARHRAHKQIVHFTKKRFAYGSPDKHWLPAHEIPALVTGLRLFLRYADPAKLHPIVSEAVAGLASLVSAETDQAPGPN